MAQKSRFAALLTGDQARLGELAEQAGELGKAADHFARAGDYSHAIDLAARAGSQQRAIRYAFKGALGADSGVPVGATARQAGDLLRASGLLKEAIQLFELATAYGAAAEVATKLKQPARAAELYERAGDWGKAAIYFESEGRWNEAVRMLGLQSRQLQKSIEVRREPDAQQLKREVDDRRAALLAKLGRQEEASQAIEGQVATHQTALLHEQGGRFQEAFDAYLEMGDRHAAARVIGRFPSLSPQARAGMLQRCGLDEEAGAVLVDAGLKPEAARLLEDARLWREAARIHEGSGDSLAAAGAYRRAGDLDDAGRCFRQAGEPGLAADAFAAAGRHSDAVTFYLQAGLTQKAATAYERNHHFTEAATYYLQSGAPDRAMAALAKVREGSEGYVEASLRLVPMLIDAGRQGEALVRIRRISDDPREVGDAVLERRYWEGRCLEALGRTDEARLCYEHLAEIAPEHRDLSSRLNSPAPDEPSSIGDIHEGTELAGRYLIGEELGRGGMGRVFRASDRELAEEVAIKVLLSPSPDSSEESRLIREVQICRRITHPNIVRIFDIGRFEGGLFVTMELLEGRDLAATLERGMPLPLAQTKAVLIDVLAGLKEAHEQSVVHRDLKPHNIFLTEGRVKILDFGIARAHAFGTQLTQTGHALGTPAYMAPEQLQGQPLDARTDLYSLGVVVFEMLAGQAPFAADNPATLAVAHVQQAPPDIRELRPGLPEPWAQFVHRLLAKSPDLRLPSASHAENVVRALPDD